jgi:hypothetical protein
LRSQPMRRTNHRAKGINEFRGFGIAFKRPRTRLVTRLFFARAIGKWTRRSPHLVNADEVMPKSRLAVGRSLDAELTHPVAQGIGMEIQNSRCAFRAMNHSICLLKGGHDMVSLYLCQRRQS